MFAVAENVSLVRVRRAHWYRPPRARGGAWPPTGVVKVVDESKDKDAEAEAAATAAAEAAEVDNSVENRLIVGPTPREFDFVEYRVSTKRADVDYTLIACSGSWR